MLYNMSPREPRRLFGSGLLNLHLPTSKFTCQPTFFTPKSTNASKTMLCLVACFSLSPRLAPNKVKVFTKLGGNFVGHVEKPWSGQAYAILRSIQDQVCKVLPHEYLPSRYLAIYVGQLRLTKPNFPFVDNFDSKLGLQVLEALRGSQRLDVLYDEVETVKYAKGWVHATRRGCVLVVNNGNVAVTLVRKTLFMPELEVWSFPGLPSVTELRVYNVVADTFGNTNLFPGLQAFVMSQGSALRNANFQDLNPCKLKTLHVILEQTPQNTLEGVGSLVNLQTLAVTVVGNQGKVCIPRCISNLLKLQQLDFDGVVSGTIPKEIGKLACLKRLSFKLTMLSSSIPSELGQLSNLEYLHFYSNPLLTGNLPNLSHLQHLEHVSLIRTGVTTRNGLLSGRCELLGDDVS